jgi:hypothetical protein
MSFLPTHRGIEAVFSPLGGKPIVVRGNWDRVNHRFGVMSGNSDGVWDAYQKALDEMAIRDESFGATLEVLGDIYNVRNVIQGDNYPIIIITLA